MTTPATPTTVPLITARVYAGFIVFDAEAYLNSLPENQRQLQQLTWVYVSSASGTTGSFLDACCGYALTTTDELLWLQLYANGKPVEQVSVQPIATAAPTPVAFLADLVKLSAAGGADIKLTTDISLTSTLQLAAGTVLDLNGKTLRWAAPYVGTTTMVRATGDGVTIRNGRIDVANAGTGTNMPRFIAPATKGLLLDGLTFDHIGSAINGNQNPSDVVVRNCSVPTTDGLVNYLAWIQGRCWIFHQNSVPNSVREHPLRAFGFNLLAILGNTIANPDVTVSGIAGDQSKTNRRLQHGTYAWDIGNTYGPGQMDNRPLGGTEGIHDAPTPAARAAMKLQWLRSVGNKITFGQNTQVNVGPRTAHAFFADTVTGTNQPCYSLQSVNGGEPGAYGPSLCDDVTIATAALVPGKKREKVVQDATCTNVTLIDQAPAAFQPPAPAKVPEPTPSKENSGLPGKVARLALGLVSITSPWHPDTPCRSKHWEGTTTWRDVLTTVCHLDHGREWLSQVPGQIRTPDWKELGQYTDAGLDILLAFVPELEGGKLPTAEQTAAQAAAVVKSRPANAKGGKFVEIGNEQLLGDYWKGTAEQFVSLVLKPAATVFRAAGYTVVLGGLNGDFDKQYAKMAAAGAEECIDAVGIHPYSKTLTDFKAKYDRLAPMLKGKWVWETESRVFLGQEYKAAQGGSSEDVLALAAKIIGIESEQWADRLTRPYIKRVSVFVGDVRDSATGPLGLFVMLRDGKGKIIEAVATPFFEDWFYPLCKALAKLNATA